MAKAKVNEEPAASEASPKLEPAASEALAELEKAVSSDISSLPASSGPMEVEEVAKLAVIHIEEEDQEEGNNERDGKNEEINKDEVKDNGKNEEINKEEVINDDNEDVKDEGKKEVERKEEEKDEGKVEISMSKWAKRRRAKKKAAMAVVGTPVAASATVANIEKEDMKREEVKDEEKVESGLSKTARRRERKKAKLATTAGASDVAAVNGTDQVGKSATEKEDMGLIFMCSAKTKKDCFRYKVFGLPESKKDVVTRVYDGMKLFLFDIDLKLMYGIYKAAGPGGYNIEPKAFKSKFPSQVRFDILTDCLPLPEEKFKAAIKENYYAKNKFKPELSPVLVKNLCKLFHDANKPPSKLKRGGRALRKEAAVPSSAATRDRKKRRLSGTVNRPIREAYISTHARHALPPAYASPPRHAPVLQPLPVPAYVYERQVGVDYYRREPLLEAPPGHRIMDVEMRPRDPIGYGGDPYGLYREPVPYQEPPLYASSLPAGYHAPPPQPPYPLYRY